MEEIYPNTNAPKKNRRMWGWILTAIIIIALAYYTIPQFFDGTQKPIQLVIYGFSTQEEAFNQGILPAFKQSWYEKTGEELKIEAVFGPSGTLAGQINLGAPADVVIFSNQHHIDWLKVGKRVKKDTEPVLIAYTPLVIITRPDTFENITGFEDLTQPGLNLLHADPRSSGLGEWAILAEYGSAYLENSDQYAAEGQLKAIWGNVRLMGSSARSTMTLFELGAGDALVTYEQDALFAQERGIQIDICTPERTILARHFAVIVDDNLKNRERPVAEAFLDFLVSPAGQQIMTQYNFRPADANTDHLPQIQHPFTVDDLGGWAKAYESLIEKMWMQEIVNTLNLEPASTFIGTGE